MRNICIDENKCLRDGICVAECPAKIFAMTQGEPARTVAAMEPACINCGHCVAVCPSGAISLGKLTADDCEPLEQDRLPGFDAVAHLMKGRRSIRAYTDKTVAREKLEALIDVARYAPSGHNMQPVHWLVIEQPAEVKRLAGLVVDWMRGEVQKGSPLAEMFEMDRYVTAWENGLDLICRGAPHVVVAHAVADAAIAPPACAIALTHLELAAYADGLGGCWAGFFNVAANLHGPMREALALPKGHAAFGAMMVGQPQYTYKRIPQRVGARITWK